ncbi:MAG: hypothetical protein B1H11_02290 [Desulfobacteraceae bacterium 4484_190.1]|nr:MAG: hypothetical protein B1H11_02290 [Desulfobacteraceae bacterium 4484_190.1]
MLPYTDEQKMIKEMVSKLAKKEIEPLIPELDVKGEGPGEVRNILIEHGLLRLPLPQEYGGIDADCTTIALVVEELAKVDSGISMDVFGAGTFVFFLKNFGTEEQKKKFYPMLEAGKLGAFCLTEPGYGSDAANIITKAVRKDDHYVVNGTKTMASNGPLSEYYLLYARTGPGERARGISCMLFEKVPGASASKHFDKLGFRTNPTSELYFEDVKVPVDCVLGKEGEGWKTLIFGGGAMRAFGASSQALGNAQGAMEYAIRYAKERQTFGVPLIQHQAIQFMFAEMGINIEAARSLHFRTLQMIDGGNYSQTEYELLTSSTKAFVCDMAMKVTTDAVQILGSYGVMNEYPIAKRMRDAKVNQIFDGTSQIQKIIVGRALSKLY